MTTVFGFSPLIRWEMIAQQQQQRKSHEEDGDGSVPLISDERMSCQKDTPGRKKRWEKPSVQTTPNESAVTTVFKKKKKKKIE